MNSFDENVLQRKESGKIRCVSVVLICVSLGLFSLQANAQNGDAENARRDSGQGGSFYMEGVADWFRDRFPEGEPETYQPEEFRIESHSCNCYDRPIPHYPYLFVIFSTPKGDLVGRPDRRGVDTVITRLAVRYGERYCDLDSEDACYGSFSDPCDFSDYRYGHQLAAYFPTCKAVEPDEGPGLTPTRFNIRLQQ